MTQAKKVLLIGWDAADWKVITPLLDSGQMPHLAKFVEGGVMGNISTLQPVLSPMLWNSVATGMYADRHGILGFTEVDAASGLVRPVTSTSRKVKALWNILGQEGRRTHVINWFGGHPAEPINGICVSDAFARGFTGAGRPWPVLSGTIHPNEAVEPLAALRVHPAEIDGELLQMFVPRAAGIDQAKDRRLLMLAKLQAEMYSIHAAATWALQTQPWDFAAVYYPSIDHFSHGFMHYHPPKQEFVSAEDFDLYHDVINSAYRFHDLALGVLGELAGPEAAILLLSDHGFHPDHLRPQALMNVPAGPAEQHRPHGIFAMRGPGIRHDERIYGASLLDIAPTVLSLFGLPAGQDMPGRVLTEAFEWTPALERIPSWEQVPGNCGMHATASSLSPEDAQVLVEQFVALGYIERPDEDRQTAVATCLRERMWNLARVYTSTARFQEALPLLEEISFQVPERVDYATLLATCQARLGLYEEARATAESSIDAYRDTALAHWVLANADFDLGRFEAALEHLMQAEQAGPRNADFRLKVGQVHLKLRRWDDAERELRQALEIDPHHAVAWQTLARCLIHQRRWEEAAEAALDAVGHQHDLAFGHFYLGVALTRMGMAERAIQAVETALTFPPERSTFHAWLARLYSRMGRRDKMWHHWSAASKCRQRAVPLKERREQLRLDARRRMSARAAQAPRRTEASGEPRKPLIRHPLFHETQEAGPPLEFIVVSGLPRSGTSVAMQMLSAAGIPVMTDGKRQADSDNPEGYYEWEEIKKLPKRPDILRKAEGKALKVISMLIPWLPRRHRYKVLFLDRPIDEVVASHRKMLVNLGKAPETENPKLREHLERHREEVLARLGEAENVELLVIDYPGIVRAPKESAARIAEFLGRGDLDLERMASAVKAELHRNRTGPKVRPATQG